MQLPPILFILLVLLMNNKNVNTAYLDLGKWRVTCLRAFTLNQLDGFCVFASSFKLWLLTPNSSYKIHISGKDPNLTVNESNLILWREYKWNPTLQWLVWCPWRTSRVWDTEGTDEVAQQKFYLPPIFHFSRCWGEYFHDVFVVFKLWILFSSHKTKTLLIYFLTLDRGFVIIRDSTGRWREIDHHVKCLLCSHDGLSLVPCTHIK